MLGASVPGLVSSSPGAAGVVMALVEEPELSASRLPGGGLAALDATSPDRLAGCGSAFVNRPTPGCEPTAVKVEVAPPGAGLVAVVTSATALVWLTSAEPCCVKA
jgi:hypothetical protein